MDKRQELLDELQAPLREASMGVLARYEALAHYTTSKTASAIVLSEEVWLSHVQTLNDVSEVTAGAEFVRARLEAAARAEGPDRETYAALLERFHHAFKHVTGDAFVFCLSGHDRSSHQDGRLAMWRAYGADGDGACLVFDKSGLLKGLDGLPVIWTAMFYESEAQFHARLDAFFANFFAVLGRDGFDAGEVLDLAAHALMAMAVSHKHPAFGEEHEIRLLHVRGAFADNPGGLRYDLREEAGGILPILRLQLGAAFDLRRALDRIILGPSNTAGVQRLAMLAVLGAKGWADAPVLTSAIPYRARR